MAGEDGKTARPLGLLEQLERAPYSFDFFQVLRRLECVHRDRPRFGRSARPAEDPLRLGQEPSLAFAPSALASFTRRGEMPPRLAVWFFGLFGPNGPLPHHLTEYARARASNVGDHTFRHFADVFHHRLMSFFYRAWANVRPTVEFDRPESDRFAVYVGSLFGMASPATRGRDAIPDLAKLHYAGHLACQTRHAEGLRAILSDFFELPVDLREFIGVWMELPESWRCHLGSSPSTGILGRTLTVGARVWECQNKFRVVFGPLSLEDYESLLPGSPRLSRLVALVRSYTSEQWAFDLQLILRCGEVPALTLGGACRLGWTTWIAGSPLERDPDDLVVEPQSGGSAEALFREA